MADQMFVTEVVEVKRLPERVQVILEQQGKGAQFIRKTLTLVERSWEFDEGERAEVGYISTAGIDRDAEILLPSGCDLSQFRKAPQVLWGHDYNAPPIGKAIWVKPDSKKSPAGILAKTVYATTARAEEIWQLVKGGFLKTFSVGFVPIKSVIQGAADWDKTCDKLTEQGYDFNREKVKRIYLKWILLEYSKVSVPANIEALTVAVAKGLDLSKDLCDELGICGMKAEFTCECLKCGHKLETDKHCVDLKCPKCGGEMRRAERPGPGRNIEPEALKSVILFEGTGAAPESAEWDARKETEAASIEDLKVMCTCIDTNNAGIKSAYKLPHHRAGGRHAAIRRGVEACMAVNLGARGGIDISDTDRRGIYDHLAKHYKSWKLEPPEFKTYCEAELKIMFAESWDDALYLNYPALKPYPNEHSCRLLTPNGWDSVRRQNDKFGSGIHAIFGIKDNKSQLQAIRFDKKKFTVTQARKWCKDHDHTCILFEPASESRAEELEGLKAIVEQVAAPEVVEKVAAPEAVEKIETIERVKEKEMAFVEIAPVVETPIVELVKREIGRKLGKV